MNNRKAQEILKGMPKNKISLKIHARGFGLARSLSYIYG
jgi:hypothetical protein